MKHKIIKKISRDIFKNKIKPPQVKESKKLYNRKEDKKYEK
jgi:hypothetical protein